MCCGVIWRSRKSDWTSHWVQWRCLAVTLMVNLVAWSNYIALFGNNLQNVDFRVIWWFNWSKHPAPNRPSMVGFLARAHDIVWCFRRYGTYSRFTTRLSRIDALFKKLVAIYFVMYSSTSWNSTSTSHRYIGLSLLVVTQKAGAFLNIFLGNAPYMVKLKKFT